MAEPFLSEIRMFSFNFAPKGWALCNGQILPINQNQALFSLLGTTYGGNGQTSFALPNLQGRVPVHVGGGLALGAAGGSAAHTLNAGELPAHTHVLSGRTSDAHTAGPAGAAFAHAPVDAYTRTAATGMLSPLAVGTTGGSQAHTNLQPYLVINFCIALQGLFPSPI
jgi:microcystin-dependent protein